MVNKRIPDGYCYHISRAKKEVEIVGLFTDLRSLFSMGASEQHKLETLQYFGYQKAAPIFQLLSGMVWCAASPVGGPQNGEERVE
jgi:hypothetical protein